MNGLNYLLQVNIYLILFAGFYVALLRNETFFKQNRLYLNFSVLLSFIIPFINAEWFRGLLITQQVKETVPMALIYEIVLSGAGEERAGWTMGEILGWLYLAGASVFLVQFLLRLILLKSSLKPVKGSAFSFFNTMVVDHELPDSETIVDHETVHMKQWHSADVLLMELTAIITWFNPVTYFYKKEIKQIHEFIADEEAAGKMQSKSDYALLLFSNTLGISAGQLSNNFFNKPLLKRRIMMLNKNKSNKTGLWKYGFSAPLFALMLVFSAAFASSEGNVLSIASKNNISLLEKSITAELPVLTENEKTAVESGIGNRTISKPTEKGASEEVKQLPASDTESIKTAADTLVKLQQLESYPEFEGGMKGFGEYLGANIKYPAEAKAKNIQGRVVVSFTVKKDGSLDEVTVVKGVDSSLDAEAIRVVKNSPKWKPGIMNGRPVNVAYNLPIAFNLPPKPAVEKTN